MAGCFAVAALSAGLCLVSGTVALAEGGQGGGMSNAVDAARNEVIRRQQQAVNVQDLMRQAELDVRNDDLSGALEKYATSLNALGNVPANAELRLAVFQRYQEVVLRYCNQLIEEARYADAETVLVRFMSDAQAANIPAANISKDIRVLLARVKSDDYYNKANSPALISKTRQVGNYLKVAQGAYELGDFDAAILAYHAALNIDPYNKAARHGLEQVEREIINYGEVARDHTRAKMLSDLAKGWEMPTPATHTDLSGFFDENAAVAAETLAADIQTKIRRIIVPSVEFQGAPLRDVVDFLVQRSQILDTEEPDPSRRGVNIIIDPSGAGGPDPGSVPVSIRLNNAPLEAVIKYVAAQVGMTYRVDQFAVRLLPLSAAQDGALITRRFQVPPTFLRSGGQAAAPAAPLDPFAPAGQQGDGGLVARITAREFLEQSGVTFPEGASVQFIPSTSTLLVRNTGENIRLIETIVDASRSEGKKLIVITLNMLQVSEETLNETGYDWLVGPFDVAGTNQKIFGGGGTVGTGTARSNSDYPFVGPGAVPVGQLPVTSGLRTGDPSPGVTIDDVISRDSPDAANTVAPAVFGVAGVFTDPQFQAVFRGLTQHKGVDRLCSSSVTTIPGQRASIRQVREFIYPTEYDPPEVPNGTGGGAVLIIFDPVTGEIISVLGGGNSFAATPANPTAFEVRELGKVMDVEANIGADNFTVDLSITTDISDFVGFINYGSPITNTLNNGTELLRVPITENRILMPVFQATKETTSVQIYDGQTVAIGGFIGDRITQVEDKVPVAGDLPGVGRFFRSQIEERQKIAIVLFASVKLIDPGGNRLNEPAELAGE